MAPLLGPAAARGVEVAVRLGYVASLVGSTALIMFPLRDSALELYTAGTVRYSWGPCFAAWRLGLGVLGGEGGVGRGWWGYCTWMWAGVPVCARGRHNASGLGEGGGRDGTSSFWGGEASPHRLTASQPAASPA